MGAVKFKKGSEEWMCFMDFWNLCQNNWSVEENDSYWQKLVDDVDAFANKYEKDVFAVKIAVGFVEAQEEKYKEMIKK